MAFLFECRTPVSVINTDITTEIVIIGTVHTETDNFNSDTLLELFYKVKPGIILVESDSSYFTPDLELNEDIKNEFPETKAITDYKKIFNVRLLPYDIAGRDLFLNDYERNNTRNEMLSIIDYLRKNKYSSDTSVVWINYDLLINLAYKMSDTNLTYINSYEGSMKIDTINKFTYEGIRKLLNEVSELNEYSEFWNNEIDFWNRRNESMLKNILNILKQNSGSRIILMCGFAHKNYLFKGIKEYSEERELDVKVFGRF